jgi:hypothetical protein
MDNFSRRDETLWVKHFKREHSFMAPQLLRSGIFAISKTNAAVSRAVPKFDDISDMREQASVLYVGPVLQQYDLRVLLRLINLVGGKEANLRDGVVTFKADEFLRSVHKDDSTRSVDSLRDSLTRLRSATFTVKNWSGDRGEVFGFVNSVSFDKRNFTVVMDSKAHWAMESLGRTHIDLEARLMLKDGVQTALADIIYSTRCSSFDISDVATTWGREGEVKEVGREVREALDKMKAVRLIKGWSKTRGRVHVERN